MRAAILASVLVAAASSAAFPQATPQTPASGGSACSALGGDLSGTCAAAQVVGATHLTGITNSNLSSGSFGNVTGTGTLTSGATGTGFTVALGTSTTTTATQTYAPTITCGTGAVGTYSRQTGNYIAIGKMVMLNVDVQAALGTCSGTITISLPITLGGGARQSIVGFDFTTNLIISGFSGNGGTSMQFVTSLGANPTGSDNFIIDSVLISS